MKRIALLFLVLTLLFSLAACTPKESQTTGTSTTSASSTVPATTAPKALTATEALALLDTLAKKDSSTVTLSVTTVTDGITLCANYIASSTEVRYSVEKLSLFPTDGNFDAIPENFVTTLTGTATVSGGQITAINGDAVTLPSTETLRGQFSFSSSVFSNVVIADGSLTADVKNPTDFLGESSLTNVKVAVLYTTDAISSLCVTYTKRNADVTLLYSFA